VGEQHIEPVGVAQMVDGYINSELEDAHRYENRDVLDEEGIYGLHALAARIYAQGFEDGRGAQFWKEQARRGRERDVQARSREKASGD